MKGKFFTKFVLYAEFNENRQMMSECRSVRAGLKGEGMIVYETVRSSASLI